MSNTQTLELPTIPASMQAVVIDGYGDSEKLHTASIPVPPTKADEVLIRVKNAGVGIWDVKQRDGEMGKDAKFPLVLGAECSGDIVRVGSDVRRADLAIGTAVFTYFRGAQGAYAQYVNVKADAVVPKPTRLTYAEAAAAPVDAVTAYQAIIEVLAIKRGETVFIAGAAGGVGTMATQLAHRAGATVLASAETKNFDYVRGLGVGVPIDYTIGDIVANVKKSAAKGVAAALDCVGGDSAKTTVQTVADGGRFAELTGTDVGAPRGIHVSHVQSDGTVKRLSALAAMFEDGSLRVSIDRTFTLADARAAQDYVEKGHVRGKVILTIAD